VENPDTGERKVRLMNGATPSSEVSLGVVPTAWRIAAAADFNGDGQTDLLWQNPQTGQRALGLMSGTAQISAADLGIDPTGWSIEC